MMLILFFFFQAEDGIRDTSVTGVQTCALPICSSSNITAIARAIVADPTVMLLDEPTGQLDAKSSQEVLALLQRLNKIGRASCRERVKVAGVAGARAEKGANMKQRSVSRARRS